MTTNNLLNYFLIHLNGLKEKTKTRKAKSFAYLCMTFACFMITSNATAQVTIGSNVSPEGGSILDLKEFAAKIGFVFEKRLAYSLLSTLFYM